MRRREEEGWGGGRKKGDDTVRYGVSTSAARGREKGKEEWKEELEQSDRPKRGRKEVQITSTKSQRKCGEIFAIQSLFLPPPHSDASGASYDLISPPSHPPPKSFS